MGTSNVLPWIGAVEIQETGFSPGANQSGVFPPGEKRENNGTTQYFLVNGVGLDSRFRPLESFQAPALTD
jgi:hypothetical protein